MRAFRFFSSRIIRMDLVISSVMCTIIPISISENKVKNMLRVIIWAVLALEALCRATEMPMITGTITTCVIEM